ncbi:hypothetical protein [Streptomyces sp. MBT62]|uniref:hypothetical protein n=1 Tax=Streptomyces sp. MBT62 TaxID=2800410 RepID=UPI00190DBBD6|nr:hypothetical protein [Streptomyces sp. MBT62]MBK3566971.1 hypothetical protein [Streptomyces sp. MBT62]
MSSSGEGSTPVGDGSANGDDAQPSNHKLQITLAVIGAVTAICVAALPFLLQGDDSGTPSGSSAPGSVSAQTSSLEPSATAASCALETLSSKWKTPDSEPQNLQYYKDGSEPKVRIQVTDGDDPSISVQGQIELRSQPSQDLVLAVWPDPNSHDTMGNKGSGHYYPHGTVVPDASGCWSDPPHSVGYPGVRGIIEVYSLALVPRAEATRLLADAKNRDGYSAKEWNSFDITTVLSFTISTA